jgi:ectoine hydroxylase-related dioxygenase (phytanoyl-CoA dioxygenase family)
VGLLSERQISDFRRDGYLKFGPAISPNEVESLRSALDRTIAEELSGQFEGERPPEFAFGHSRKGQELGADRAIHQFVNIWKVAPEFRAVLSNTTIVEAVRELMSVDRVRLWHDQVISKPPGENKLFACHHDFYFWPLDRPTMVTCWLALDDATPENGCMHVVPGSHRDPRYQPVDCDLSADIHLAPAQMGQGEPASLYDEVRASQPEQTVPVPLKAGESMFHHCLNYHLTPQNRTERQRRAFVMIFMPDGTRYSQAQSPNHICTNTLGLKDGDPLTEPNFPLVPLSA